MEDNNSAIRNDLLDDEIDLFELFLVIWKRKVFIVLFVLISSLGAVVYSLNKDNIYESKVVISPSNLQSSRLGGLMEQLGPLSAMLPSSIGSSASSLYDSVSKLFENKIFLSKIVDDNRMYDKLFDNFEKIKDKEDFQSNKTFLSYKAFREIIKIEKDKGSGFVTISVRHKDRFFAKESVDILLNNISQHLKKNELQNINIKIENYKEEIANASDIVLKNRLSELVATLIHSKVMANAQKYFGFDIVLEPYVSDQLDKVAPKRALICVTAFVTSFILAIFLVFFIEFVKSSRDKFKER